MKAKCLLILMSFVMVLVLWNVSLAQFGSLSGRVTDEVTGDPIAGAAITLSGIYCVWHTDGQGYYLCDSIPAEPYIVFANAASYYPETFPDSVMVFEGENTPNIDFALTPMEGGTGSISGRVTDEATGDPIAGAAITLSDLDCDCMWHTDSAGYYLCDHLPADAYLVYAQAGGYYPETYPESVIVVAGEETTNIDFALAPVGGEPGVITGRVTDEETGLAIIMARVVAIGLDNYCYGVGWSDTGGYYGITSLCPGVYQVTASKEGYAPETYPDSVVVIEGEVTTGVDFTLELIGEYGSISGWVTDEETGYPISMTHLTAIGLDNWCFAEAWSDSDGYYLLHHMCSGIYQIDAHAQGYLPETYPDSVIVIVGENTPDINFALTHEGGSEFGSISGRVTDEQTGIPLPMAEITISGLYCIWHTDTAGYYLCDHLPPDSYEVNARKDGYQPETYPSSVVVVAGQNTPNIDFALIPLGDYGSISGRVTDQSTGLPLPMTRLLAIGLDNWCFGEGWSDSGGYYQIPNMCAGIYQVSAQKPGYVGQTYPDSVVVLWGEDTPGINFDLLPIEVGDITGDGTVDIGDGVFLLNYLFKNGPAPDPPEAGDINCDGMIDLGDVVRLVNYLYKGGDPPCGR